MTDGAASGWMALGCPNCRVRLRLKEEYAHLRGRCPECGYRIDAPRPMPAPVLPEPVFLDSDDDSPRLVPMEEEWPEPARLESEESQPQGNYAVTPTPKRWPESPAPADLPPAVEGYGVEDGWTEAPALPTPELPEAYDVGAVPEVQPREDEPILYRLSRAERKPLREPPPPTHPLLEGIYLFPWQAPANVRVWLLLSLGIGAALVLAIGVNFFSQLIVAGSQAGAFVFLPVAAFMIIAVVVGAYGASVFLAAVQDTAAGNRDVRWPDEAFFARFAQFLYLLWLASCAIWPVGIVLMLDPALLGRWTVAIPLGVLPTVLFPIFLLSSLTARNQWVLLHGGLLLRLGRQRAAVLVTLLVSAGLAGACAALGYFTIIQFEVILAPVTAAVWSAVVLIYGRFLGRVAWLCARNHSRR
jgi:hypothetical protein